MVLGGRAGKPLDAMGDLVFTTNGRTPVSGFAKAKERLDRLSGVRGWRLHDRLIGTGATGIVGHAFRFGSRPRGDPVPVRSRRR